MTDLLPVALLLLLVYREWRHARERREWREERLALLQAAQPGLRIGPPASRSERPIWTDAREAEAERAGKERP